MGNIQGSEQRTGSLRSTHSTWNAGSRRGVSVAQNAQVMEALAGYGSSDDSEAPEDANDDLAALRSDQQSLAAHAAPGPAAAPMHVDSAPLITPAGAMTLPSAAQLFGLDPPPQCVPPARWTHPLCSAIAGPKLRLSVLAMVSWPMHSRIRVSCSRLCDDDT